MIWTKLRLPARGRTIVLGFVGGLIVAYLIGVFAVWWWWDFEPDDFDVVELATKNAAARGETVVTGYTTAATTVEITRILLEKRGGFLSNDLFPPGVWMDNVPRWEFGVLTQVRDMSRAMRIDLSRSQSQSAQDPDLSEAEGKFFYDNSSWIFPTSESEYRDGVRFFESYLSRLSDPTDPSAQFYARADNLRNWLDGVVRRLGDLTQRLSESVGKHQLNLAQAGDPTASTSTPVPHATERKTSWFKIDDVFYEARGQTWALLHLLRAAEHDFSTVLDDKNARVSLRQIMLDLEATQQTVWSPMVLNGGGFGMLANHSLVLASHIARANAAVIDLRDLLDKG